ncbi:polysaccharide lyase family 7 protein [Aquimarina sp. D1M17]|uniref:polysaccharide lyase family 7 protein n=1 Tax=Aquimarina acroporae TaxID=2937283 RepID=UPI0020C08627|nr:polysaccharide lyase family 7 protein [Aquimarina acroporae]MCK8523411.1 polysaccharide lyase family 7 protein [Aquimarina acroporae]
MENFKKVFSYGLCLIAFTLLTNCTTDIESVEDAALLEELNDQKQSLSKLSISSVSANGDDGNVPANTLDGNLNTRWSSLGRTGKYITYDLGSVQNISRIKIAWFKGNQRKAFFKVRVGNSTSSLSTVVDRKQNGSSGNTTQLETYDFNQVSARYVRISSFGNSSNDWNSVTEVEIYGNGSNGGGNPPPPPSGNTPYDLLGLQNWKLNGLEGSKSNNNYVDQIPNLSSYTNSDWFFLENGWSIFQVWSGSDTSSGSGNPRMELRELTADGDNNIFWDGTTSKEHRMKWKVRVDRLPSSGKVCFGQIHDKTDTFDDVIRVQCQGSANQTSGSVKMRINGYVTEVLEGGGKTVGNFNLGEEMYLELTYQNKIVKLYELNSSGNRIRTIYTSKSVSAKQNYFKAGNYLQSMKGKSYKSSDYGRVAIQKLDVFH